MKNKTVGHPDSGADGRIRRMRGNGTLIPLSAGRSLLLLLLLLLLLGGQQSLGGGMGVDGKTDMPLDNRASTGCP